MVLLRYPCDASVYKNGIEKDIKLIWFIKWYIEGFYIFYISFMIPCGAFVKRYR